MKIIGNNNELYVQVRDLNYLLHEKSTSIEDANKINKIIISKASFDEYVQIKDSKLSNMIFCNSDILLFNEIYNYSPKRLEKLIERASLYLKDLDSKTYDEEFSYKEQIIDYETKRKYDYIKFQLQEMLLYKLRKSKCHFPNIENPCEEQLFSDDLRAILSLDYDKVLISSITGKDIEINESKEFCETAYKVLLRDKIQEEENYEVKLDIKEEKELNRLSVVEFIEQEKILKNKKGIFRK